MTDKPKRVRGKRQPKPADTSKISDETLAADMKAGEAERPSIADIEHAMDKGEPVSMTPDGTVTIGDGVPLQANAHPGSELNEDAIEAVEIDVPLNEHMQALIAAGEARGWLAGRAAALALVHAEIGSEEAQQNHQAWVNCCHALIRKISALRLPG